MIMEGEERILVSLALELALVLLPVRQRGCSAKHYGNLRGTQHC